jgi:peptidoglycan/xylan/chitin deacetylase (PgdA/CDA1 family)
VAEVIVVEQLAARRREDEAELVRLPCRSGTGSPDLPLQESREDTMSEPCGGPGSVALKQAIKNSMYTTVGAMARFSGATWARERARAAPVALRVLMYHKVNGLAGNPLSVSPEQFRKQLVLAMGEYSLVAPDAVLAAVREERPLPPKALLLTFDDGYRDNYEHAYPILKERGLHAVLFVPTDFIGSARPLPHDERLATPNPTLTWIQLAEMRDVFTIGSHGRSHRVLTALPRTEAEAEIETSKAIIEDHLGDPVLFFSYPKGSRGDYDLSLEETVRAAGYAVSFVTLPGGNTWERVRSGRLLRRYNVEPFSNFTFALMLEGSCDLVALKDTAWGQKGKLALNRLLRTSTR